MLAMNSLASKGNGEIEVTESDEQTGRRRLKPAKERCWMALTIRERRRGRGARNWSKSSEGNSDTMSARMCNACASMPATDNKRNRRQHPHRQATCPGPACDE